MQEKDESKQAKSEKIKLQATYTNLKWGSSAVRLRKVPSGEKTITEKAKATL